MVCGKIGGGETVFCNPPYGSKETGLWTEKCYREGQKPGTTVVLLIPARTDRASFHDYVLGKAEIRFLRGRLKFELDGKPMGTGAWRCCRSGITAQRLIQVIQKIRNL